MTFKELQYFIAVADTCHFGKAAELCEVSQSTLSIQIGRLETGLGVKLLHRHPIQLTSNGVQVIPWARLMLMAADELSKAAKPHSGDIDPIQLKKNTLSLISKIQSI